jgi:hypothetical protein
MRKLATMAAVIAISAPLSALGADSKGDGVGASPDNSVPPEKMAPPSGGVAAPPGENLSEKLDKSNGVITPKLDVDPKIEQPAPAVGTMPVVPPPAGPGAKSGDVAK